MTKSDEDLEDVARWSMDFCREFGIKIDDEQFFIDKIKTVNCNNNLNTFV